MINHELIVSLYNEGNSISKIQQLTKVSCPTISKILKANNIEIKKINYQKLNLDIDEINRLYDNGMTTYQLGEKYNCSYATINRYIINIRNKKDRNKRSSECIDKITQISKDLWKDQNYIDKVKKGTSTIEYKNMLREVGLKNYHYIAEWVQNNRNTISEIVKKLWADPEYRGKQEIYFRSRIDRITKASVNSLKDPIKRKKWINKLRSISTQRQQTNGFISTLQRQLYYLLKTSNIEYHEEGNDTTISPFYVVDCVIPKQQNMLRPLIIECQGEYWHSLPHVKLKDRQKATYIRKHTDYDLLCIEELEMTSPIQITKKLETYGLCCKITEFSISDLEIKIISEQDAQMFYSVFHYSGTIRKGAIVYGAYYQNELIAAISYTYPLRIETATKLNCELKEVLEISRLARRTDIICKNLMSFLIGFSRKLLSSNIKYIVSFSDLTYGHSGTTYKASGFKNDGIIKNDYYYLSMYGKYHKKTIWDRAKRMKMSEIDYAKKHGLAKVYSGPKIRWVYSMINI